MALPNGLSDRSGASIFLCMDVWVGVNSPSNPARHFTPRPSVQRRGMPWAPLNRSNAVELGQQNDDQRGARVRARIYRATTLYSVGPRTRTMMQSYASVAKLRSGGPILCYGVISHGVHRVTATSNRHRRPVTSGWAAKADWRG
jgi:hypothetical protein